MTTDHEMASILDLRRQHKEGMKNGHFSIPLQRQNVRSVGLVDEKRSGKAKGIIRSESRLAIHNNGKKHGSARANDMHANEDRPQRDAMTRSRYHGRKQGSAKAELLHGNHESQRNVAIDRRKLRSAGPYSGRKHGTYGDAHLHADQKRPRKGGIALSSTIKQKMKPLKFGSDEPSAAEEPRKIGIRDIRLDPNDITNKRLDDDTPKTSPVAEKKEKQETQISKNAQFRAIQPSPAILSYISDNLLGRRRSIELRDAGYNIELSAPLDNIPFSKNTERERIEDNVFRNKLKYFAAAKVASSFPPADLPEIAFAGRSNVGKSSLLNALTRQWGVVRTSDKPGLTQTINFFKLGSKLCLVDLPGYGFAYAKEEVKESWEELVKTYVTTRVGLKRVCVLVDTKWGMKPGDQELISLMERSKTQYQIILTKTDLVFPLDVARRAMQIQEALKKNKSMIKPMMMVSSKSGAGVRNLRTVLSKFARFARV